MDEFCKLVHNINHNGLFPTTAGQGLKKTKCPAVRNIHRIPTEMLNWNLLKVFGISLEMSSDPKKYFGFTFDEFTELVYTVKIAAQLSTQLLVLRMYQIH